jgi:hypothetical protein
VGGRPVAGNLGDDLGNLSRRITYCAQRGARQAITSLYNLLLGAGGEDCGGALIGSRPERISRNPATQPVAYTRRGVRLVRANALADTGSRPNLTKSNLFRQLGPPCCVVRRNHGIVGGKLHCSRYCSGVRPSPVR